MMGPNLNDISKPIEWPWTDRYDEGYLAGFLAGRDAAARVCRERAAAQRHVYQMYYEASIRVTEAEECADAIAALHPAAAAESEDRHG